jgi:hypothetical protein
MELEQVSNQIKSEVPTRILETVEPRCDHFGACESPSRRLDEWACHGHVSDQDRLIMCAVFNRFENPEEKPEYMSGRDWIKVLQRKVRANESAGDKLRDKTRTQHR